MVALDWEATYKKAVSDGEDAQTVREKSDARDACLETYNNFLNVFLQRVNTLSTP